jgi:hypothetical protein
MFLSSFSIIQNFVAMHHSFSLSTSLTNVDFVKLDRDERKLLIYVKTNFLYMVIRTVCNHILDNFELHISYSMWSLSYQGK